MVVAEHAREALCFTVTKKGQPAHPLYQPDASEMREWRPAS
jgi:hypothetical protein